MLIADWDLTSRFLRTCNLEVVVKRVGCWMEVVSSMWLGQSTLLHLHAGRLNNAKQSDQVSEIRTRHFVSIYFTVSLSYFFSFIFFLLYNMTKLLCFVILIKLLYFYFILLSIPFLHFENSAILTCWLHFSFFFLLF